MQIIRKVLTLCLLFLTLTAFGQSNAGTRVEGTVLNYGTNTPVEFAVVVLYPSEAYSTTDKNGRFEFKNVGYGKSIIKVQYIGMETIEREIIIKEGQSNIFNFEMKEVNFRLQEVVVTATQNKAGQSTASKISRQAMDHLQTASVLDVMQLLPGGVITNPDLSSVNTITLRTAFNGINGAYGYGAKMNSLGTAIILDGAPISQNANMQTLAASINGNAGNAVYGTDLRNISADNIESIEIIRGIASVEYGDITNGAVLISSKAGVSPLSIRVKANPLTYQASLSKGFSLGNKGGAININGDYAYNNTRDYESYLYYQRFNLSATWTKRVGKKLNTNTNISLRYGKDTREQNPDDQRSKLSSAGKMTGMNLKTAGSYNVNKGWFQKFKYDVSFTYTDRESWQNQLLTNASSLHSSCVYDGAILSNTQGKDIYDIDGKKITNIPDSEKDKWVQVLPYSYVSYYKILGKEINGYAQIKTDFNKRWDNINNHIKVGLDYRMDGNIGDGKVYDEATPPFRNNTSDNSSYRKRPYNEIPFIHHLGAFLEDTYTHKIAGRNMVITGGLRYDWVNGKNALQPRLNAAFGIVPQVFTIRGGYGVFAKAPTAIYLYPEKAYFNYNNYYNEQTKTLVSTVRVFDTENKDLKIATNRKIEAGFDLHIFDKYRFSVTAYDELMENGYDLSKDFSCFKLIEYNKYDAVPDGQQSYVPKLKGTYNIFSSYAKPLNNSCSHNRGIEYELDLGRFKAIRTSVYINGAYIKSTYKNKGNYFDQNNNGNAIESHIAVYEKELYKIQRETFSTTFRITHNIPEIGFVVTLATQVSWMEKFWTDYGNDTMFIQYISYKDGKVHDFDPSKKDDPEFAYMFDSRGENRFTVEKHFPTVSFNLNISKEIGGFLTASFFANNMFNNRPLYESKAHPGSFTELLLDNKLFFGFDLKINIK